jgi:hypothetical protein
MAKRFHLAEFTKTLAWWNKTFISLDVTQGILLPAGEYHYLLTPRLYLA